MIGSVGADVRYGQTLLEAAKASGEVDAVLGQLSRIASLLREEPRMGRMLADPEVASAQKLRLFDLSLDEPGRGAGISPLVRAFLGMVIGMGRASGLPGMVDAFQQLVDKDRGRMRVIVRSAHPLPEALLQRLNAALGRREGKDIELIPQVDPALLGGVQILLEHRVIDGSVERQLAELRKQLKSVRVS